MIIASSTLIDNSSFDEAGGIYNNGENDGSATLQIGNSILSSNSSFDGGAIYNDGQSGTAIVQIVTSTLNGNLADGNAGGIYNDGSSGGNASVQIANSTLSENQAGEDAGGIYNAGFGGNTILTISNCTLSGNTAGSSGGGINNNGEDDGSAILTIINSTLSGNSASSSGGGILNDGVFGSAILTVTNSTLSGNSSSFSGGGIYNDGSDGNATLTMANSILSDNSAGSSGGGIFNDGEFGNGILAVTNSTLSGNSATNSGGGIYMDGGFGNATLAIASSTLSSNSATDGGGIFNTGGVLEIGSTILNAGSGLNITNDGGTVLSHGHNLSSDAAGGNGTTAPGGYLNATGDIRNTNPKLGPLQDNGGPTFTHALLTNSPAINAGSDINSPGTDQRGVARPQGAHSDIGAFELEDNPPVAACRNVTVTLVSGCTTNVSVNNGSSDPDLGNTITLSQSPAGPYSAGTNIVTLTVTDNLGATNSCTATVIVIDNIAPTITCPSNKTAQATSPAGAVVSFADPVASDNCSATVSCVPPSGSTFPIGDTVVHCTVTDAGGNTDSCTFTVHVKNASEQLVDTEQVILGLGIDPKIKKSVLKKFQKIEKQINTDHTRNACKQLQNLLRKVQQDLFKERLTNDQAIQITTPLVQALTVLGCP